MKALTQSMPRLLANAKCIWASTIFLSLWLGAPSAWPMAEPVEESQIQRFDALRQADVLMCEISSWELRFDGFDTESPSLTLAGEKEDWPLSLVFLFNKSKTKALQFFGTDAGASPVRLVPPEAAFSSPSHGALLLPFLEFIFPDDPACLKSPSACRSILVVTADPAFKSIFPMIGGTFRRTHRSEILAGQCRPGLSESYWLEMLASYARPLTQDYAACGYWWAQWELGANSLLRPEPFEEHLVDSYRWLAILRTRFDELDPEEQRFASLRVQTAMDIAAERMTPEQIREAERLAAEWAPDPSRCYEEPETEAPETPER